MTWPRTAGLVAATEVRRRVRRLLARPKGSLLRVGLYVGAWVWLFEPWRARPGRMPAAPGGVDLLAAVRGGAVVAWLGLAAFAAVGATTSLDDVPGAAAVVPAAGVRATLLGLLVAEHVRRLAFFGVVLVVALVRIAVGAGSPVVLLAGLVAGAGILLTSRLAGELLGLAWAARGRALELSGRTRLVAVFGATLGFLLLVRRFGQVASLVGRGWLPLAWYGDLLLLGTPGVSADPRLAAAAVVGTVVAVPALFLAVERLAGRVWFDPPAAGSGTAGEKSARSTTARDERADRSTAARSASATTAAARSPGLDGLAAAVRGVFARLPVGRPSRAVAWRVTVRALRQPSSLAMLALPLFMIAVQLLLAHGHRTTPLFVALYGAWGAGVGATLNPLAAEGPGLPALLSAPVSGRQVVRGYVLAGLALAAPLVTVVPVGAALLTGVGPGPALSAVALGGLVALAGVPLSVAVGLLLPRLGALSPTDADALAAPQRVAVLAYSVGALGVALPAVVGLLAAPGWLPAGPTAVAAAGFGVSGALAAVVGVASFAYAASRFDGYELSGD